MTEQQFDVFLCHNSEDKPAVIQIAQQLRQNNLKPWLDVWELQPGAIWQYSLEQQIEHIGAAAVFPPFWAMQSRFSKSMWEDPDPSSIPSPPFFPPALFKEGSQDLV